MAIQYAGGTLDVRTVVVGANCVSDLVASIAASITAAGWTVTNLSEWNALAGSANAANGNTATIAGRTYTFNTVLGGVDSILIGATALETLQNLKAAINLEAGIGVKYGLGTTLNASVTAFICCPVNYNGGGQNLMGVYTKGTLSIAVSASGSYGWYGANLGSTLYQIVSVETPAFQQVSGYIAARPDAVATRLSMFVLNRDGSSAVCQDAARAITAGQTYRTISHRYGFHNHIVGTYNTRGTGIYLQSTYLPSNLTPCKITGATNASPIAITTSAAHGYTTGDSVLIKYVTGNTGANGTWTITVTGGTTFTLDTSSGTGAFTGTKGLSQNLTPPRRQIMEYIIGNFINNGSDEWVVNSPFYFGVGTGVVAAFGILDGGYFINNSTYNAFFPAIGFYDSAGTFQKTIWASGDYSACEPSVNFTGLYGGNAEGGQLFNSFVAQNTSIAGGAAISADGHNWYGVYNNGTPLQLFLMVS